MTQVEVDFSVITRRWFCHTPHPDYLTTTVTSMWEPPIEVPYVFCTRQPGHEGEHAAFTFKISEPECWSESTEGETE